MAMETTVTEMKKRIKTNKSLESKLCLQPKGLEA
jgi:hypothetical protein